MPDASAADAPIDRRILPVAVVLVTWAGILAAASRYAWAFYSDDAFISLRYSARLLQGRGLTWTDGEWVEGYSNLLWVLGCAALGALGVDIVQAPRMLAAAGVLALLFAIARGDDGPDPHRALSGGLFVAATGGIGVWIMGGLSQAVVASLGTLFLVAVRRGSTPPWLLGGLAAALTLLRIDGFVWLIALTVGAVAAGRLGRRALGVVGGCAALTVGGQQVFRLVYYGDWVPNTARVKVSFTPARAFRGADWVADATADNLVLVGVAVVAVALLRRRDVLDAPIAAGLWIAYCAFVGGDIFHGHRLLLPALPLLALSVADLASARRSAVVTGALAVLAVLHGAVSLGAHANRVPPGVHWTFLTEGPASTLRARFGADDPLLAVDGAGALPYYTGFRSLDMLGLTDRWLATHPPPTWGRGGIGHDLGSGPYVLGRRPDIIAFQGGLGGVPSFLSGREMEATPDWPFLYRKVVVAGLDGRGELVTGRYYFRSRDSVVGFQRDPEGVTVPGWFLSSERRPAVLEGDVLGPRFPPGDTVVEMFLPNGAWTTEVVAPPGVTVSPRRLDHRGGLVRLTFHVEGKATQVEALRLHRVVRTP